jgi:hypothetical protein
MVADDDIGLAFRKFFFAFYPERTAGKRQKDAHPNAGIAIEPVCLLWVRTEITKKDKGDEEDQHGADEDEDGPDGPDPAEDLPYSGGGMRLGAPGRWRRCAWFIRLRIHNNIQFSAQSTGSIPLLMSHALALEKCRQPKNPLSAEKGDG